MSQAGHLQPDPKGKCSPRKHSSDVRPQNRSFPQYRPLSKIPHPHSPPNKSQSCIPRGGKEGGEGETWSPGEEGRQSDSRLASASAKRA